MSALAFDFTYDEPALRGDDRTPVAALGAVPAERVDGVSPAPVARRRLYAVRGTVDEPHAAVAATALAPVLRAVPAPTLDDILGHAWSALATGVATCPGCHEDTMTARWSSGHHVAGGRCASCGTTLE